MKVKASKKKDGTIVLEIQGNLRSKQDAVILDQADNRIKTPEKLKGRINSEFSYQGVVLRITVPPPVPSK